MSASDPWYTITTRTDGTHVETAAYQGSTVTASAYIAYKSHYSMASTVDRVESIWLHDSGRAVEIANAATDGILTDWEHHPMGVGTPTRYLNIERDSSANRQILVGPVTPDAVYRLECVVMIKTTDGSLSLDNARWPVVLSRASAILYEPEFPERAAAEMARFQILLNNEWASENEAATQSVSVGEGRYAFPGNRDFYLRNLPQYGRVVS